jgi:hypothetical protein
MIPILMGLGLGALLGGGVAAAQGKDPLQGALMGGLGGALGGAFMPGVAGAAGAGAAEGAAASATGGGGFLGGSTDILAGATGSGGGSLGAVTPAVVTPGVGAAGSGGIGAFLAANKYPLLGGLAGGMMASNKEQEQPSAGNIYDYDYSQEKNPNFGAPGERYYSSQKFALKGVTPVEDYKPMAAAAGGIVALAEGGNVSRFRNPAGAVNPAVAAYNAQLMEMSNQQYNVNKRPAPNQVPGSAGYVAPPVATATTATTGTDTAAAGGSADPISGNSTRYNPVTKRFEGEYGSSAKSELDKYREELFAELDARYGGRYSDPGNSGGGSGDSGAPGSEAPGDSPGADGSDGGEGGDGGDGGDGEKNGGLIKHRYAMGGLSSIGNYSDGGQLLRGPGDGVSDSIPAQIGARQPARLADGEFVVPARIVSEIGNGSTAAGAKRLYAMMDRVQKGRKKTVGKDKVAVDSKAHKMLPA